MKIVQAVFITIFLLGVCAFGVAAEEPSNTAGTMECYYHRAQHGYAVAGVYVCGKPSFSGKAFKPGDYIDFSCSAESYKGYIKPDTSICGSYGCSGQNEVVFNDKWYRYRLTDADVGKRINFVCWVRRSADNGDWVYVWKEIYYEGLVKESPTVYVPPQPPGGLPIETPPEGDGTFFDRLYAWIREFLRSLGVGALSGQPGTREGSGGGSN